MADTSTIASLATAGGTLVLAVATFSATRSANRSARVTEQSLKVGLRPVLFNARPQDPPQKVGFIDDHWLVVRDGLAAVQEYAENLYLAIPLRNVAAGLAVLHGWHLWTERVTSDTPQSALEDFRRLNRDLYVPAGDISFWQAAIRDPGDQQYASLHDAMRARTPLSVDILYGDHEGGQRTITASTSRRARMPTTRAVAVALLDVAALEPRSSRPPLVLLGGRCRRRSCGPIAAGRARAVPARAAAGGRPGRSPPEW